MDQSTEQNLDIQISARSLLKFSVPTIFSLLFVGIYSMVGSVFVARLVSTDALSSVNIVLPLVNVSVALGMMLATGGSAIVAKLMGENRPREAKQTFSFIFLASLLLGILLSVLGLILIDPIIRFLGADDSLYTYCYDYARYTLYLFPAGILAMLLLVFTITAGKAQVGSLLAIIGGVSTILLDWLLIAVLHMGVIGAALASGLGYAIPAVIGIAYFFLARHGTLYFVWPKGSLRILGESCINGSSEMVTNLSLSVVTLLFNRTMMRLAGSDGVAAVTVILYAEGFFNSAFMGYTTGIAPVISFNYGCDNRDNLKHIYRLSRRLILIGGIVICGLSMLAAKPVMSVFVDAGTDVYNMGVQGFYPFSICFLFMGFSVFGSSMFTALSNGKISALISISRTLIFQSACILILPLFMGLTGVWLAVPVAELLGAIVTQICNRRYKDRYGYL